MASRSGCIILLDPVAAVRDRQIVPAEAVLPVPAENARASQNFISLILREYKIQIQPEIPRIIAVTAIEIYTDFRIAANKALHSHGIAEVSICAEFQKRSLRLQAVLLCKLLCLGVHYVAVSFPVVRGQRVIFRHFLPISGVFFFECVEVRTSLVGIRPL